MLDGLSRVNIRMVDAHLRNKGRTQTFILEMFKGGMITDNTSRRPDPGKAQKMLQFAIPEILYDKEEQQRDIQYEENELLIRGQEVPVNPWEYHYVHADTVEEMLNSIEWKSISGKNPKVLTASINHWKAHQEAILTALGGNPEQQGSPEGR